MVAWNTDNGRVAIIASARTPLTRSGAALRAMRVPDLARAVMQETLHRAGWSGGRLDEVYLGNVCMPADAANPARVASIQAGIPQHVPALTVQRNCASGLEAIFQGASRIFSGQARFILTAGAESMSNIPLLFPRETSGPMAQMAKAKTLTQKLAVATKMRPRHFVPISALLQGLTDPLCNMIMGKTAEVLSHEFSITRDQQDAFALQSHQRAAQAISAGQFDGQITPIYTGQRFEPVTQDIGPRQDQTFDALAKLRPIFDRRDGSVTVGNSCQITDGAACILLVDGSVAGAEGLEPLGYIRACATAALEPQRMGLGPVYAIDRVLQMTGLSLDDIGLFEINEAFAAQVLACRKAIASDRFCQLNLGHDSCGDIDDERLNVSGGAIALGHPVGATGARIVLQLLDDMQRRNVQFGIASLCVAGGQGAAILVERR